MLIDERPISRSVFDPTSSIFKSARNKRAECATIWCKLAKCPLLELNTCMWAPIINWTKCPYGRTTVETGPTKRAQSFYVWVRDQKQKYQDVGIVKYPAKKMAFIGEYIYLPYSFMCMNEAVPFLQKEIAFGNGICLIPQESWNLDIVLKILDFHPRSLMGGIITDYQKKEIPLFLLHLRETDPAMWSELIIARPKLDITPNHIGRKALIKTLNHPITWTTKKDYPVKWIWNGTQVITHSAHSYSRTWGDLDLENFELCATPTNHAAIIVQNNAWVNENTVFVD